MMREVPPIYPWSAFDSARWIEAPPVPLVPRRPTRFGLHAATEEMKLRLMSEFDRVTFERIGVLRGEFLALTNGLLLCDRAGAVISINLPFEASATARIPYEYANGSDMWDFMEGARRDWELFPLVENAAVVSHIYHNNYYHFSFEFLQKFRLFNGFGGAESVLIPPQILEGLVYRELIAAALGPRMAIPMDRPYRVKDPVICQTYQSDEGLKWLRALVGRTAAPGGRKLYITRAPKAGRSNNNLAETPQFQLLLAKHRFERVDFGMGDLALAEQIARLDGAAVILASHGAGLTNLAYLNAPVRVIEVFGRKVISSSFIRISEALGLEHHAIISEQSDAAGDIVVDSGLLDQLISAPL
ncbi:MAG TPA: glycosyltransferase family 61 protein [Caulobacteraceae bacterium]|jgi:hypothetical protein